MIIHDTSSPEQKRGGRLRFDRYVLDLDRGCLLLDGKEVVLRPKTFAVLQYLVEHPGRLVSKDGLFAAAWPKLTVTDDALVQSIGELRRAIGDNEQRLIKTIPRRGYRFQPEVCHAPATDQFLSDPALMSNACGALDRPPEFGPGVHKPPDASTKPVARVGFLLTIVLAAIFGTGALLYGAMTDWSFFTVPAPVDRFTNVRAGAKPAVAVLPLRNQSDDQSRDYFADGLTQDIINALGKFSDLTVMSWNAVSPYKTKGAGPDEVARSLAVRYQVEGSVRQSGDRVRVAAQLVATDGRVLWSGSFDEALAAIFEVQNKITNEIAGALAIRVTEIEQRRAFAKPTESLEAYDYVLRARPALQRPTRGNIVEARNFLRKAVAIDPSYAAAYSALAETYYIAVSMGWAQSARESLRRAEDMANKALSLSDSEVRAHTILGRIHLFYQRHERARSEIDRAIAINPNDAHALAARGNILMWSGETEAAIEALELAQRIDPELNAIDRFALGLSYYLQRRYDMAVEQAELNLRKTEGAHFSRVVLAAAYAQLDRVGDAARVSAMIRSTDPTFDAQEFGTKFLIPADLDHLRAGLRKAGLYFAESDRPTTAR